MRCHFVYSVPLSGTSIKVSSLCRRVLLSLQKKGFKISAIGRRTKLDVKHWPKRYPCSVTANLYEGLQGWMDTLLYDLREETDIEMSSSDVFLGHPRFPFFEGSWGVTGRSIRKKTSPLVAALISPLHCNAEIETTHINKAYLDSVDMLMPYADVLFAVMGEYWWDLWDKSRYSHWKPKMVRLDLAVDIESFPRVKKKFSLAGRRKFLYIGRNDPMKGVDLLSKLAKESGYSFGWVGRGGEIDGVKKISGIRELNPDFMSEIAKEYDFFITTGRADPNPTTILESMAWGFPVICTPQSGYYETPYLKNVFHDDIGKSLAVLNEMQLKSEEDLLGIANRAREVVNDKYNFSVMLKSVKDILSKLIETKRSETTN